MPAKWWTPERDAVLRSGREAGEPAAVLAARLGVTPLAAKVRAVKIGAIVKRRWTPEQDDTLRRMYPTHTAAQIGEALGVPVWRVVNRVGVLGLVKYPHHPPEVVERVRALNAAGKCDREIHLEMADVFKPGLAGFYQVKSVRRQHGLPYVKDRDAKRRSVESQRKALGVRHGGDLRKYGHRRFAERNGWPEDLPPRCVQILNVLCERGPLTALQLAEAIGTATDKRNSVHGGRRLLTCSAASCGGHGTYTGLLKARGLIQAVRKSFGPGGGQGRHETTYSVTLKAITTRQEIFREREQRGGERGAGAPAEEQDGHHPAGGGAHPAAGGGGGGVRRGCP